ncbi:YceI family protein [Acetobacter sp.]|uniref:YceI family protein n=1 Tax=Acetobacter sp. TaxID=440 RepID=UPI0039EBB23F
MRVKTAFIGSVLAIALHNVDACAAPTAETWVSDPVGTWMEISFTHSNLFVNTTTIPNSIATVVFSGDNVENAKFNISCAPESIWSHNSLFVTMLREKGFFDAAKNPTIYFTSTSIKKQNADTYEVKGNLSMNRVTRPVTLAMTASKIVPFDGVKFRAFTLTGIVDRKDFGMNFQEPKELQDDPLFGKTWNIKFTVEVTDKPNASKYVPPTVAD